MYFKWFNSGIIHSHLHIIRNVTKCITMGVNARLLHNFCHYLLDVCLGASRIRLTREVVIRENIHLVCLLDFISWLWSHKKFMVSIVKIFGRWEMKTRLYCGLFYTQLIFRGDNLYKKKGKFFLFSWSLSWSRACFLSFFLTVIGCSFLSWSRVFFLSIFLNCYRLFFFFLSSSCFLFFLFFLIAF